MAETVKKTKAPAKTKAPKAAAAAKAPDATKKTVAEQVKATTPTHHEIAELARHYWAERGYHDGHSEVDWLRAEQELSKAS